MTISFHLEDHGVGVVNISTNGNQISLFYPCSSHSLCTNYIGLFPSGIYILETWGASGGLNGGLGGYSKGTLHLTTPARVRIFVGAEGGFLNSTYGKITSSYNGGGGGFSSHYEIVDGQRSASSGGGGTDVRLLGRSLYHRAIVAGGGGGGTIYWSIGYHGGDGGGEQGFSGNSGSCYGDGGNQTSPGTGELNFNSSGIGRFSGSFGHGGQSSQENTHSGGGGGWFGGASSYVACGNGGSGGGGSGYVLNQSSFKPVDYVIDSPGYYLRESILLSGKDTFTSCFNEQDIEEGHKGNGCARITVVFSSENCPMSNVCSKYFPTIFQAMIIVISFSIY